MAENRAQAQPRARSRRAEAARAWADSERQAQLQAGRCFVSEAVFSHPSKLELLADARSLGFEVALCIVCLDEPRRLLVRVQRRVHEGGHDVPAAKILARYPRMIENLRLAVRAVPLAMLCSAGRTSRPAVRTCWLRWSPAVSSRMGPGCPPGARKALGLDEAG